MDWISMALSGNHGQIIPRDKTLLDKLYWEEKLTLSQIAKKFGCTDHSSVRKCFDKMGIPRRCKGSGYEGLCIDCNKNPIHKIPHKLTKHGTGKRCKECHKKHKHNLAIKYNEIPSVKSRRKLLSERAYLIGPLNPKGEKQWIRKGRALLRTVKRIIRPQKVGQSQNKVLEPEPISLTLCQH
jgi:hypothetical protein